MNELKLSKPLEILSQHEFSDGGKRRGRQCPVLGRRGGETPERSPCGVRTMLKLQMAACKDYAKKPKGDD